MSPLQALILDRMHARGWTPKDVEDRGVKHATLHRYMNPVVLSQPPRKSVLQSLATALDLPLSKVEKAAVESVGYDYTQQEPTSPAEVAPMRVDLVEAIQNDPGLLPEAKTHLINQYGLLLRLQEQTTAQVVEDEVALRRRQLREGEHAPREE